MAKKKSKKQRHQQEQADLLAGLMQSGIWPGAKPPPAGVLSRLLGKRSKSEQFLLGALLGAGAAWLLSDPALRGKLMKAGMQLYASLAGGIEEMKEQAADLRAELEAAQYEQ